MLSRYYVEQNSLYQTPQKSDEEDKKYNVWDYVFLDGEDLHTRYKRANKYGPILFRFNLDMLMSPSIKLIQITKSNPWYWKENTLMSQKFYNSSEEFKNDYLTSKKLDSQIMFLIKSPEKEIKLNKFLHSIGVDIPKLLINLVGGSQMSVGDYAFQAIEKSLKENGLNHIPILKRHGGNLTTCGCHRNYNYLYTFDYKEFKKRFGKNK
ncbi:hypothetical protein [Chryseobacterium hagamense]|nr:hypothetical protein [Chryseobacterium hagamense]